MDIQVVGKEKDRGLKFYVSVGSQFGSKVKLSLAEGETATKMVASPVYEQDARSPFPLEIMGKHSSV